MVMKKEQLWELQYLPTKERLVHGTYTLCQSKLNSLTKKQGYKILKFKK